MPGLLHQPKVRFRPPSTWAFLRWRQLGAVLFVTKASRNVHRITLASWRGLQCPFVVCGGRLRGQVLCLLWFGRIACRVNAGIVLRNRDRVCVSYSVIQTGCCRLCVSYWFKQVVVCMSFTDSDMLLSAVQVVARALATDSNRLLFVSQLLIQIGFLFVRQLLIHTCCCFCVSYWFKQVVRASVTESNRLLFMRQLLVQTGCCLCVSYWFKQVVVCASITD